MSVTQAAPLNRAGATIANAPHRAVWPDFTAFRPCASAAVLSAGLRDATRRTRRLFAHLNGERLTVPLLPIVNPPLWELGHVAHFYEFWTQRGGDTNFESLIAGSDALYDSAKVAHDSRWTLALPRLEATWHYLDTVIARVLELLDRGEPGDELAYFVALGLLHHDMHNEAFTYMWHTLGYPAPPDCDFQHAGQPAGDAVIAAGRIELGAKPGAGFVFDNEKWAHEVRVPPFAISRRAVTNGDYAAFVEATGQPVPRYWRGEAGQWQVRRYDRWLPLPEDEPVMHVSWHEAVAYCAWARRRLPSEAEWQAAANAGVLAPRASGVWEWTSSRFAPFEGFAADPYKEYSAPWFAEDHRVLKGGSFASSARLARLGFRNFFKPERADVFCGFRTCAID